MMSQNDSNEIKLVPHNKPLKLLHLRYNKLLHATKKCFIIVPHNKPIGASPLMFKGDGIVCR